MYFIIWEKVEWIACFILILFWPYCILIEVRQGKKSPIEYVLGDFLFHQLKSFIMMYLIILEKFKQIAPYNLVLFWSSCILIEVRQGNKSAVEYVLDDFCFYQFKSFIRMYRIIWLKVEQIAPYILVLLIILHLNRSTARKKIPDWICLGRFFISPNKKLYYDVLNNSEKSWSNRSLYSSTFGHLAS
jgi:hypothetical protein